MRKGKKIATIGIPAKEIVTKIKEVTTEINKDLIELGIGEIQCLKYKGEQLI